MMAGHARVTLECPEHLRWVQDATCVWVFDARSGAAHCLSGTDAAVWGWMTMAYPYDRLVELTGLLLNLPPAEAEQHLAALLQAWIAAGLLEIRAGAL